MSSFWIVEMWTLGEGCVKSDATLLVVNFG